MKLRGKITNSFTIQEKIQYLTKSVKLHGKSFRKKNQKRGI